LALYLFEPDIQVLFTLQIKPIRIVQPETTGLSAYAILYLNNSFSFQPEVVQISHLLDDTRHLDREITILLFGETIERFFALHAIFLSDSCGGM